MEYKCECGQEFTNEFEYKKHQKVCKQECNCIHKIGIIEVDREGYRDNLFNGISVDEFFDKYEGYEIEVTINVKGKVNGKCSNMMCQN